MADWAHALATGLGAAANTGANIIGDQMKQRDQMAAEQRAADIKLDLAQRMAAADEMMKNRAAERFSGVVKAKMGEEVPVEAPSVNQTGITRDAGKAAGYVDVNGTQVAGSFNADPATLRQMLQNANRRLMDPASTDEQRTQAQELVTVLQKQIEAQSGINAKAVEGKTRKRTAEEAAHAALEDTLTSDAPAFMAGTGMLSAYGKLDDGDKKLKLQQAEAERKERQANADRESRERTAAERDDSRERIAAQRMEAMFERLNGGKNGAKSAMVQNLEWLKTNLKFSDQQLADFVTEKKHTSAEDIAAKLLSADKFGDLTPETAMEKATKLVQARDKLQGGTSSAGPADSGKRLKYNPATGKVE
jgi:hypothetical protein